MPAGTRFVVLSPHLDDSVFTFWHVLRSPANVRVVTVFAGIPAHASPLERGRGLAGAEALVLRRRADDRAALALAGREPTHLDLLDTQYRLDVESAVAERIAADPDDFVAIVAEEPEIATPPEAILDAVWSAVGDETLGPRTVFCVPVGVGGHPDHRDVGRAGVLLHQDGRAVRFYADIPYVLRAGLPSWVSGESNAAAEALVAQGFAALDLDRRSLGLSVVRLGDDEVTAKIACAQRYETEFGPANQDFGGILTDPAWMCCEAYWSTEPNDEASAARA